MILSYQNLIISDNNYFIVKFNLKKNYHNI